MITNIRNLSHVLGELLERLNQRSLFGQELDVSTVLLNLTILAASDVVFSVKVGETPLLGDDNLLLTGELVTRSTESLNDNLSVGLLGSDRDQDLANVNTGSKSLGLTPGTSHTLLQSIGSGTRQHLVDTENVEGVNTDSHVERLTSRNLGDVLVGANTGGLESLRRKLLKLVGDEVDTERELVGGSSLTTQVIDTDLGVGDSTVVSALGEGLVLAVTIAAGGSSGHGWSTVVKRKGQ